jgi:hypothetical protein
MAYIRSIAATVFRPGPFTGILAIFTTLVGFYITSVVEELRAGYTAIYSFERNVKDGTVLFHLDNISRAKRIDAANFRIRCTDQDQQDCFGLISHGDSMEFVWDAATAPNFGRPVDPGRSNPTEINVCLGVIAASRTSVEFRPKLGLNAELIAFYDPWSTSCKSSETGEADLFLLTPHDTHAFVSRYYFSLMTYALGAGALILVVTGLGIALSKSRATKGDIR